MINDLFSWHMLDAHCDLTRLTMVVEVMELDDTSSIRLTNGAESERAIHR